jgi:branched-chain amino acid transport system permease protein
VLILRSRRGLAMQAARDSEVGARCLGVNVRNTKLLMWVIAALWTGATGALIHLNSSTVTNQDAFSVLSWTALVVFIVVIGGVGSQIGPIIGVVIFWFITDRFEDSDTWRFIILGSVAVVMAAVARSGVDGLLQRIHPFEIFPVRRRLRQDAP